ncbi:MAG: outer membrane lipoprotein chaperone LolA [Chromatocurvus sp.]
MCRYREYRTAWQRAALSLLILLLPMMAPGTLLAGGPGNGPAARALGDTLSAIDQLSGRFRQTIYPESGGKATRSTGEFQLQAPGRFLWRIESPDNQLVVTEGTHLWHYDADLQTATRRPLSAAGSAPLQVLAGDRDSLARDFTVSRRGDSAYTLLPTSPDAGFQSLELTFEDGLPAELAIVDNLSQRIEITLEALSVEAFDSEVFNFTPADGVDVFIHDA